MQSDVNMIRVEMKEGFEKEVKKVCKLQASRDKARKLVGCFTVDEQLVLMFELAESNNG